MKQFIVGLLIGIFLTTVFYFYINTSKRLKIYTAHILDRDTLYLKDGSVVKGWITKRDDDQIWIEGEEGYFTIPRSECKTIVDNVFMKYVRELM